MSSPKLVGSPQESFWQRTLRAFSGVRVRVKVALPEEQGVRSLYGRWTSLDVSVGILETEPGHGVKVAFGTILECEPEPEVKP